MLFFSDNKIFATLILVVSFFTPFTGASGLIALLIALMAAFALGFDKEQIRKGLLTYSVVLFGLGFGTNFEFSAAFVLLLIVGSLLTLFISIVLNAVLNKRGLPALSLAFIISTAIIFIASKNFEGIGLTHRRIYWFNDMYALGGSTLVNIIQSIEDISMPEYVNGFFRSMSAILFQVNIATGIILSIGLLLYSRIAFVLMILGYTTALFFSFAMGGFQQSDMTYYNMGTNFMLVAVALGGFYIIPSLRSFLWILITVPIAYLLVMGLGSISFKVGVPVFSLPFCATVILFLYTLQFRRKQSKLVLTPIQYYSPEENLYRYINGKERLLNRYYHQLFLPILGEWMVSQGHNGTITHKGDWSKALDFVILDDELKTYRNPGNQLEHFYCYNKPVLSPADGYVEQIVDFVEDNEIGQNNVSQNWGNSIVIKHAEGLYTKLSHLRKGSFRVTQGSFIKRGDIVAFCGNSGRSPEPHLHFQVQSTPYIGSKTLHYPLAYFISKKDDLLQLNSFTIPQEGTFVSNVLPNVQLQQAFSFQHGYIIHCEAPNYQKETWEVMTNIYNESYLYCMQTNSIAYFIRNDNMFYFTNFYGQKNSLLFLFYLSAYKVLLSTEHTLEVNDTFPLNTFRLGPLKWIQDLAAPFYIFLKIKYSCSVSKSNDILSGGKTSFQSKQFKTYFSSVFGTSTSVVEIENNQLQSFTFKKDNKIIKAICSI